MRVVQRVRLWLEAEGPGTTRPKQGWPVAVSECGREVLIYFVHIDSVHIDSVHIDWNLTVLHSPSAGACARLSVRTLCPSPRRGCGRLGWALPLTAS